MPPNHLGFFCLDGPWMGSDDPAGLQFEQVWLSSCILVETKHRIVRKRNCILWLQHLASDLFSKSLLSCFKRLCPSRTWLLLQVLSCSFGMSHNDLVEEDGAEYNNSTVGGAVGIAVGEAIISTLLPKKLAGIPGLSTYINNTSAAALNDSVSKLHLIPVSHFLCVSPNN